MECGKNVRWPLFVFSLAVFVDFVLRIPKRFFRLLAMPIYGRCSLQIYRLSDLNKSFNETVLYLLLGSVSNGGDTSHKKYSVQSPLSFRKIVEIERFALRRGGLLGWVSNLSRGRGALSSPETSLCCGEAGEKEKESAQGTMVRGKREERLPPFPSSHLPLRAFYFSDYCYFYRDTQREPLRRREGREGCTAINPDAVPSVHVTKMAACTGKHSIFRILRKIGECEQSTYKVNSLFSKFITFVPCALICQKLVNFLELNSTKNCIEV